MRTTLLTSACAALALLVTAAPAHAAGVAVIDVTAIAKARELVATATKQLNAINQQVSSLRQVQSSIGSFGQGSIGNILAQSGMNFSGPTGLLRDVEELRSGVSDLGREVSRVNPSVSAQQIAQGLQSFTAAKDVTNKIFYLQGQQNPQSVLNLRASRAVAVREASVQGYGAAMATKGDLAKSKDVMDRLSQHAKTSTDLRTDVQINTSVQLAQLTELTKQTALLAQMLEIDSSRALASDPTVVRK